MSNLVMGVTSAQTTPGQGSRGALPLIERKKMLRHHNCSSDCKKDLPTRIRAIFVLSIVLLLLFPSRITRAQSDQWIADLLEVATKSLQERRYEEAVGEFQLVLKALPQHPEILSNLGLAYHLKGSYTEAIAAFKKALEINPGLVAANLFLGIDYLKLNEPSKAISPLQKVLRLQPRNSDARLALGTAYLGQRQYLQAARELEIAARAAPENPETWYQLGKMRLKLGDEAANHLRELDPNKTTLWTRLLMAEISLGRGRYRTTERELKKLRSEYPSSPGVHSMLGGLYLIEGRNTEAEEQFKEELRLPWKNLEAWYGLMQVALLNGNPKAALDYVERIIAVQPGYLTHKANFHASVLPNDKAFSLAQRIKGTLSGQAASHFLLGLLYGQMGNLQAAEKHFQIFPNSALGPKDEKKSSAGEDLAVCSESSRKHALLLDDRLAEQLLAAGCLFHLAAYAQSFAEVNTVLANEPDNLAALFWQAKACKELALLAFQKLVVIDPDSFRVHQLQGQIYATKFQLAEGVEEYRKAIRLRPNLPSLYLELGMLYRDHAKYELAISEVQKALKLSPNDPEANYVLGDIYVKANKPAEAIPYLEQAVTKDPNFLKARLALGKAYRQEGRIEDAIREPRAALLLDRSGEIHYQLSHLFRKSGRVKEAKEEMTIFQRIRKERMTAARKRGVYGDLGGLD